MVTIVLFLACVGLALILFGFYIWNRGSKAQPEVRAAEETEDDRKSLLGRIFKSVVTNIKRAVDPNLPHWVRDMNMGVALMQIGLMVILATLLWVGGDQLAKAAGGGTTNDPSTTTSSSAWWNSHSL